MQHDRLETQRLWLWRPTIADELILRGLWRNEKVRSYLGGIVSDENIDDKILTILDHWNKYEFGQWTVCQKTTNNIIGICGLHHSEDGIEISYMFFPEFWGKGLAKEAVRASLEFGFNVLKLNSIIAITQEANHSSCQLLDSLGMDHIENFWRFNVTQRLYKMIR